MATQRVFADNECYPGPDAIAAELRGRMGIEVVVSPRFASVQGLNLVNVVSGETECNRLVLAIRAGPKGRVFVLDSDFGPVYVKGGAGLARQPRRRGRPAQGPRRGDAVVAMHKADEKARFEVNCPGGNLTARRWLGERRTARERWGGSLPALLRATRGAGRLPRHLRLRRPEQATDPDAPRADPGGLRARVGADRLAP